MEHERPFKRVKLEDIKPSVYSECSSSSFKNPQQHSQDLELQQYETTIYDNKDQECVQTQLQLLKSKTIELKSQVQLKKTLLDKVFGRLM